MKVVKRISSFYRFNFFFDENGLFWVGGCLKYVDLMIVVKYFIIFLRKGYVIGFIIFYFYNMVEY